MKRGEETLLLALRISFYFIIMTLSATFVRTLAAENSEMIQQWPTKSGWPEYDSDLTFDPNVKLGVLSNGMRYALLRHVTPLGHVSLRLRIGVGSIQESPQEAGMAHFIEHLAYRGSTNVPDGEAFRRMERFGAEQGADANASTDQTQTVFKIDAPEGCPDAIDSALAFFRETASELLFTREAIATELKVILAEERLNDSLVNHIARDEIAFYFKGQPLGDHFPIGNTEVLGRLGSAELRQFYDRWYRPDKATLVVVGDIDPAVIEKKIIARFSNWSGRGTPGVGLRFVSPLKRSFESSSHVEYGAPTTANIAWVRPFHVGPDSKKIRIGDTLTRIAIGALNQRFQDSVHGSDTPFIVASATYGDQARSANTTILGITTSTDGLKTGIESARKILDEALQHGFTKDEVAKQTALLRGSYQAALLGADQRSTRLLADALVDNIDAESVFMRPADEIRLAEESIGSLSIDNVNAAARAAFSGSGPLLFITAPNDVGFLGGTFSEIAIANAQAPTPVSRPTDPVHWPYNSFGPKGQAVKNDQIADIGASFVTFENGVRLAIKPTAFRDDQVLVTVSFGRGRASVPIDKAYLLWALDAGGPLAGGLDQLSLADIQHVLSSQVEMTLKFQVTDDAFQFVAQCGPHDLETELQLITAYIVNSGWHEEGFNEIKEGHKGGIPQMETSPSLVLQAQLPKYLHHGDARWQPVTIENINRTRMADVKSIIGPALSSSPLKIAIVGNVSLERSISAVAKTLGSLPERPSAAELLDSDFKVKTPDSNSSPVVLRHRGRSDVAAAVIGWTVADSFGDWDDLWRLELIQHIAKSRLYEEFRTRSGASYSPVIDIQNSFVFPGFGYLLIEADTRPDKTRQFYDTVDSIVVSLRTQAVSLDEIERSRKPLIAAIRSAQETNEYWVLALSQAQLDIRRLDFYRSMIHGLEVVTPKDIQTTVRDRLNSNMAWRLEVLPELK